MLRLPDGHGARPADREAFDTLLPAPAGLLAAGFLRVGIGFFPLRDRAGFVVRHLVVHAGAVLEDNRRALAFILVVADASRDPLGVVGALALRLCWQAE